MESMQEMLRFLSKNCSECFGTSRKAMGLKISGKMPGTICYPIKKELGQYRQYSWSYSRKFFLEKNNA